jgi:hypothetical protein
MFRATEEGWLAGIRPEAASGAILADRVGAEIIDFGYVDGVPLTVFLGSNPNTDGVEISEPRPATSSGVRGYKSIYASSKESLRPGSAPG